MQRKAASLRNFLMRGETVIGQWPIDRRPVMDREPISLQMAKAMVHLKKQHACVTKDMLIAIGFTPLEVSTHGDMARARAVYLAPKLADKRDLKWARYYKAQMVL